MNPWTPKTWAAPLMRSLEASLGLGDAPGAGDVTPTSLAMEELRATVSGAEELSGPAHAKLLAWTTDAAFFNGYAGHAPLYEAIELKKLGENEPGLDNRFTDLWYESGPNDPHAPPDGLLQKLDTRGDRRGVLLVARSGSGKTTAQRYAALKMLEAFSPGHPHLPFFINKLPPTEKWDRKAPCLLQLLAHLLHAPTPGMHPGSATPSAPSPDVDYIALALQQTPATVFCDLNDVAAEGQLPLAKALVEFQKSFGPTGSRVVAVYRAVGGDPALGVLQGDGEGNDHEAFLAFEQDDLRPDQAYQYIERYLDHRQKMCQDLGLPPGPAPEMAELRQVVMRCTAGADPIISTPLLMHFVAMLGPEDMAQVQTAMDLYDRVVERYLKREARAYRRAQPAYFQQAPGWTRARIYLTRFALATLHEGPAATSLPAGRLASVCNPGASPRRAAAGWVREDDFWSEDCPYYANLDEGTQKLAQQADAEQLLARWLPIRHTGDAYKMIHDSFLYYFAAKAVTDCEGPGQPGLKQLNPEYWPPHAARRLAEAPQAWTLPARFIADNLPPKLADPLVAELLAIGPEPGRPGHTQLVEALVDRVPPDHADHAACQRVYRVLRNNPTPLRADPERLLPAVYEGLVAPRGQDESLKQFGAGLAERAAAHGRTWPRWFYGKPLLLTPLTTRVFDRHRSAITCMIKIEMPGADHPWIASADESGVVMAWDPRHPDPPQTARVIAEQGSGITGLLWTGQEVVAGDRAGRVIVAKPDGEAQQARVIAEQGSWIECLLWTGQEVVAGDGAGRVIVAKPDGEAQQARVIAEQGSWIECLLWTGQEVVAGDGAGRVIVAKPDGEAQQARVIAEQGSWITGLLWTGQEVVAGDDDGRVIVAKPDGEARQARVIAEQGREIECLLWTGQEVVAGDRAGRVIVAKPDGEARQARVIAEQGRGITSLLWTGQEVVAGDWGGRVIKLTPSHDTPWPAELLCTLPPGMAPNEIHPEPDHTIILTRSRQAYCIDRPICSPTRGLSRPVKPLGQRAESEA